MILEGGRSHLICPHYLYFFTTTGMKIASESASFSINFIVALVIPSPSFLIIRVCRFKAAFLAECYAEDIFEIKRDFPRIQRYSLFVNAMSITEAGIVSLCHVVKRIFDIPDDVKGKGPGVISVGIKYLHDNAGFDLLKNQYYISLADDLRNVRNCITHAGGCIRGRMLTISGDSFLKPLLLKLIDMII